jgi:hypothetical protein
MGSKVTEHNGIRFLLVYMLEFDTRKRSSALDYESKRYRYVNLLGEVLVVFMRTSERALVFVVSCKYIVSKLFIIIWFLFSLLRRSLRRVYLDMLFSV